jgi:hypothetical protein
MLPTLACVKKEKTVDYIVGFDELGGSDDFSTHTLAGRLSLHGLITYDGTEDYGEANPNQPKIKGSSRLWETMSFNDRVQQHLLSSLSAADAGVQRSVRHGGERAAASDDEDSDFE